MKTFISPITGQMVEASCAEYACITELEHALPNHDCSNPYLVDYKIDREGLSVYHFIVHLTPKNGTSGSKLELEFIMNEGN